MRVCSKLWIMSGYKKVFSKSSHLSISKRGNLPPDQRMRMKDVPKLIK